MNAGDIVLIHFPFSVHAPDTFKQRPVLVISHLGSPPNEAVGCVMITGNPQRSTRPGPGDIAVAQWQAAGLAKPSTVRCRRVWTAEGRDIVRKIGKVDRALLDRVRDEVRRTLNL